MKNWNAIFQEKYKPLLKVNASGIKRGLSKNIYDRSNGFQIIFDQLLEIKQENFQIIETGTVRNPMNWKDGNSGFLFAEFVKEYGGFVRSVDIDQNAVNTANNFVNKEFYKSFCSDSVSWLSSLTDLNSVDLFYLDSWDVEWWDDDPSAQHHLKEFKSIEPYLNRPCIVAIDDNSFKITGTRTGKGRAIYDYLKDKNIFPIYDEYQIIYKF
jgi:hypothetical protein